MFLYFIVFYFLFDIAGLSTSEDNITLQNSGTFPIAFKIRVSVQNMFSLPEPSGVLMGGEVKRVSVLMRESSEYKTTDSIPKAKFLVELVPVDDGYNTLGPKGFWASKNAKEIVKKQILAEYQMMR